MAGIAVAGSILVDKINAISAYPEAGQLTQIRSLSAAVGGLVPNVAIDLKALSPETPIYAVGKVGDDGEGKFLFDQLGARGIDTAGVRVKAGERTSFTEVMSVVGGQRTFFTYAGASADFGADDVDLDTLPADMLHLGYFLLLDKVDRGEGEIILRRAKEKGIRTSIDLVTENSDRYRLVLPCLKYTDNLIINEVEAGKLAGMEPERENLRAICEKLMAEGVRERVIIHMPKMSVCLSADGYIEEPSCRLPEGFIVGTTGAGDAFCAGCLLGIYRGLSDREILELGTLGAVCALSGADAVSGMRTVDEARALVASFG